MRWTGRIRSKHPSPQFFTLLWILVFGFSVQAADISLRAEVDKTTVALDEMVTCTITLSGSTIDMNNPPRPSLPSFTNLTPVSQSQSTNISILNGQTSASFSYLVLLKPGGVGSAAIGPSMVNMNGIEYKTEPIKLTVTKASGLPKPSASPSSIWDEFDDFFTGAGSHHARPRLEILTDPILAETSVSRTTAYVNQQIILTFTFYHRVNLYQAPGYSPPKTTGFWAINLPTNKNLREVEVKGLHYMAQDFNTALFPTSAGKLSIGPAVLTAQVDPFANPVTIKTLPINMRVLPLPETGKPAGFSGAVGKFNLSAQIERATIEKGKPFTINVKIAGEGNIQTITEPFFEPAAGLRKLSGSSKENIVTGYSSVSGSKTFELVFMPVKEGEWIAGPFKFSYFDPEAKSYKTVASQSFKIKILPSTVPLPKEFEAEDKPTTPAAVKISFDWKGLVKRGIKSFFLPVFQFLFWGIILIFLGWFGLKKYQELQLADPVGFRRRQAIKTARRRLKKANGLLRAGKLKEFITEIYEVVENYLGDKLNFTTQGMTSDQLRENLEAKGISPSTWQEIENFIHECDLSRFTPSLLDRSKAENILRQAEKLMVMVEAI